MEESEHEAALAHLRAAHSKYFALLEAQHQKEILQLKLYYQMQLTERDALIDKYRRAFADLFEGGAKP